jgi:hypothetical protein
MEGGISRQEEEHIQGRKRCKKDVEKKENKKQKTIDR